MVVVVFVIQIPDDSGLNVTYLSLLCQRWREAVAARTKLKRQMRAFPAAPCGLDSKHQLKALSPSAEWPIAMENLCKRFVNLGNGGKLGISCTR